MTDTPSNPGPKSPQWVALPSLIGVLGVIALMVLHLLPESTHVYLAWAMAIVPLGALVFLTWSWRQRAPVSRWEMEYLRVGIGFLTIAGIGGLSGGAWPLTLVAGPCLFVWTVVEKRRADHGNGRP